MRTDERQQWFKALHDAGLIHTPHPKKGNAEWVLNPLVEGLKREGAQLFTTGDGWKEHARRDHVPSGL